MRDWSNFEYEHKLGLAGGAKFLEKILKISPEQDPELKSLREDIKSCFEIMQCYLLPHPGHVVTEEKNFTGKLKDIRGLFVDQLKDFVPRILSPQNLIVKTMNGNKITAMEFNHHFVQYMDYFNGTEFPTPGTLLEVS